MILVFLFNFHLLNWPFLYSRNIRFSIIELLFKKFVSKPPNITSITTSYWYFCFPLSSLLKTRKAKMIFSNRPNRATKFKFEKMRFYFCWFRISSNKVNIESHRLELYVKEACPWHHWFTFNLFRLILV